MTKFASPFSSCFPCGDLESSALQVGSNSWPRLWLVEIAIDCIRYYGIAHGDSIFVLALGSGQNPSLVCLIYILLHRHGQSKIFILSKSQKFQNQKGSHGFPSVHWFWTETIWVTPWVLFGSTFFRGYSRTLGGWSSLSSLCLGLCGKVRWDTINGSRSYLFSLVVL